MHPLDAHFLSGLDSMSGTPPAADPPSAELWWATFEAQATSRLLDFAARDLQQRGLGFYTIGSAGHEVNALVAEASRPSDPALLHYRSGAFYVARATQLPGGTPVRDILQGLMAKADEPIAGGRHKVFGHPRLGIIPQTSTIASHLPRAVGLAILLHRAQRLGVTGEWPEDAVVLCSFGDASVNHSTAVGAINAGLNAAYRGLPVPILFICEDNGFGISVPTPPGWVAATYADRHGLDYSCADGTDPVAGRTAIADAVDRVRISRRPGFLHLRTVRFLGHAGSDPEISYRKAREIEADYTRDPLLATARVLICAGVDPASIRERYQQLRSRIDAEIAALIDQPALNSAAEVVAPLAPRHPAQVTAVASAIGRFSPHAGKRPQDNDVNAAFLPTSGETPGAPEPRPPALTLAQSINQTLDAILTADRRVIVFGEDVGVKGGVYGVTGGLARRHGTARVFDTILDEQSILGLALGAGLTGLIPIPEIQYLAYLHNAADQLRGEAATQRFFSQGRWTNPMVVRIAGLAYQKGFGGHFHNDNAVAALLDIPGLVVGCPSRADDAAAMLRTLVAAAITDATVSVFLEPIALYHHRDLHQPGDGLWLAVDPESDDAPIGTARYYPPPAHDRHHPATAAPDRRISPPAGKGPDDNDVKPASLPTSGQTSAATDPNGTPDLTLVSFGNGVPMSLRVARRLAARGITADVVDLRWLSPLPVADLIQAAERSGRVLVVDETRHSGGVGQSVITALVESGFTGPMSRVASRDSFVPLGAAAGYVLLSEHEIEGAAISLTGAESKK